jgi:putative transposase
MKQSRFLEEQIIGILREHEAGAKTADVCRKHGISSATFYKWKSKYGGLEVSDARLPTQRNRELFWPNREFWRRNREFYLPKSKPSPDEVFGAHRVKSSRLGQILVIHTNNARSLLRIRRRGDACRNAMLI